MTGKPEPKISWEEALAAKSKGAKKKRGEPELENVQIPFFQWKERNLHLEPRLKWLHASLNGVFLHPATLNKVIAQGLVKGIWDACLPYPSKGKCALYLEAKWGRNKLSDNQEAFKRDNEEYYEWAVCYSWEEMANAVCDYLGREDLKV